MIRSLLSALLMALLALACIPYDPDTGKPLPREGQRYRFEEVVKKAEHLHVGMTRVQVLFLLGSPAEHSPGGDVWTYLPERKAVVVPARALRLEFKGDRLTHHGYRPIVLGETL